MSAAPEVNEPALQTCDWPNLKRKKTKWRRN